MLAISIVSLGMIGAGCQKSNVESTPQQNSVSTTSQPAETTQTAVPGPEASASSTETVQATTTTYIAVASTSVQTATPPPSQPTQNTPVAKPVPKPTPAPAPSKPTPKTITVTITNMKFSPQVIAANVGDMIVWVNKDTAPHTTTSDGTLLWDSGTIRPGGSYKRVFAATGSYNYHCGIHPSMHGTVIVRETN